MSHALPSPSAPRPCQLTRTPHPKPHHLSPHALPLMSSHMRRPSRPRQVLPYIYTPTVGEACQQYHALRIQARGLYLRIDHRWAGADEEMGLGGAGVWEVRGCGCREARL